MMRLAFSFLYGCCLSGLLTISCVAQTTTKASTESPAAAAEHAIALAAKGRCREALCRLKSATSHLTDKQLKYRSGMATARCAMSLDEAETAVQALFSLRRDFPSDPEVLYTSTHFFSELASRASQELAATAPNSPQAQQLEGEALESQGNLDGAIALYKKILDANPRLPGIHYRLGRIFLAKTPPDEASANHEFEEELKIDPENASAEFMLGESARQKGQWDDAIARFSKASKLDEGNRALLDFAEYWDLQLHDCAEAELPDNAWIDLSKHSFARELMTRPGGIYPKYGAVDRDYAGSEYDGFQDVFTSAISTNMEWGRLDTARLYIDNYFTEYVDEKGMIDMRGPETAQFGMTLSLLARYFNYSGDGVLLLKHRAKIEATAKLLAEKHDESLRLPPDDSGYGLIRGWSESDSCLMENPSVYWQPYYANSAFAARGLRDISAVWTQLAGANAMPRLATLAVDWLKRSNTLRTRTAESLEKNIQNDKSPPYIGLFPGTTLTFRESLEKERPSPQQWPHRPYAELLQADVLPTRLANLVIDGMRAYGATTLGVVANVGRVHDDGREILGFISYGYAQMLLRLDRIEEFLLFLYSHRYHAHTRGSWTAGEVTGITGDSALYCVPAQQTIPLLVRWMLVLEDSDEDRLHLAKGVPRQWVASGNKIGIEHAPTRWGRVSFSLQAQPASNTVVGHVELSGTKAPGEVHFKVRLPSGSNLRNVTVNGQPTSLSGVHGDTIVLQTKGGKRFEIVGRLS